MRDMSENVYSQFFDSQNAFFNNLNTKNVKLGELNLMGYIKNF